MILYICKIINTFYYNYSEKLIATFLLINFVLSIIRLIIKPEILNIKKKYSQPVKANATSKQTKRTFSFCLVFGSVLLKAKSFIRSRNVTLQIFQFFSSFSFFSQVLVKKFFLPTKLLFFFSNFPKDLKVFLLINLSIFFTNFY